MIDWIRAEGTGHWFFLAFPVCLLVLFIMMKGRRMKFLVPSLIISLVILNPWFYMVWTELGLYAYWRVLWIIPVIPIVASVVPAITEKLNGIENRKRRNIGKAIITVAGAALIVLGGSFIYNTDRGQFVYAANAEKVPGYVAEIGDKLLELNENPRVIAQDPIGVYLRQYSGSIDTLYGRDMNGYILWPSKEAREIHNAVSTTDWSTVNQYMLDDGIDYLVANVDTSGSALHLLDYAGGNGIYRATGSPTVVKTRNELGQIVAVTTVDENGKPIEKKRLYDHRIRVRQRWQDNR